MHDFKALHASNAATQPVYTINRALVDGIAITAIELAICWGVFMFALHKLGF